MGHLLSLLLQAWFLLLLLLLAKLPAVNVCRAALAALQLPSACRPFDVNLSNCDDGLRWKDLRGGVQGFSTIHATKPASPPLMPRTLQTVSQSLPPASKHEAACLSCNFHNHTNSNNKLNKYPPFVLLIQYLHSSFSVAFEVIIVWTFLLQTKEVILKMVCWILIGFDFFPPELVHSVSTCCLQVRSENIPFIFASFFLYLYFLTFLFKMVIC